MNHNNQSKALKFIRTELKMSQGEFAKILGYTSPQYISNAERGLCGYPNQTIVTVQNKFGRALAIRLARAKVDDYQTEVFSNIKGGDHGLR